MGAPAKELLMVAYFFPPLGGGGVQRTLSFVRHLPRHGWRPTVLAAAADTPYWAHDPSLLARVPPEVQVERVGEGLLGAGVRALRRLLPRRLLPLFDAAVLIPDRQIAWLPGALARASRLCARRRFSAIYSTGAPWTDHLVAAVLAHRRGLPWVADFRDPWTQNQRFDPPSEAHRRLHRALEAEVYARADAIIANTETNRRALEDAFPAARGKVLALPNGYEEEELRDLPQPDPNAPRKVLAYSGSFYPGYGPERFYALLEEALARRPELRPRLRLLFMGKTEQAAALAERGLGDLAEERGYLPQAEALRTLSAEAHATLLVLPPSAGPSGWVPQKLYVYLRLGRPILALCPEGEADDLIRAAGGGSLVVRPGDPDGATPLGDWLAALAEGRLGPGPAQAVAERYERARLAARLAETLDAVVERRPPRG